MFVKGDFLSPLGWRIFSPPGVEFCLVLDDAEFGDVDAGELVDEAEDKPDAD